MRWHGLLGDKDMITRPSACIKPLYLLNLNEIKTDTAQRYVRQLVRCLLAAPLFLKIRKMSKKIVKAALEITIKRFMPTLRYLICRDRTQQGPLVFSTVGLQNSASIHPLFYDKNQCKCCDSLIILSQSV